MPVPLKHTAVEAHVAGFLAAVDVVQSFHNPFDGKIEAVYRFPLPQSAAVDEFLMVIGERRIRGILREREEAERLYRNARSQGYTASLLTQERPNLFTRRWPTSSLESRSTCTSATCTPCASRTTGSSSAFR